MALTNVLGLPDPIYRAVSNDTYDRGQKTDFSVTQLIAPPRIRVLRKRHWKELQEDVSDRIYSLMGQSIHTILERANIDGLAEVRIYAEIDGLVISGQLDRAVFLERDGLLQDYKMTSVWTDLNKPDWEQQLNLLSLLLRLNGKEVTKQQIVAIYRDWSKSRAKRESGYPQHQARTVDIPLWPHEKALAFVKERIKVHTEAEWNLPECTPDERWYRGEQWAVMKDDNKRATSLHDFKDQAEKEIEALAEKAKKVAKYPKFRVEHRPGTNTRCLDYCQVSEFCEQFRSLTNAANDR